MVIRFETVQIAESYHKRCEDRVAVINSDDRSIIVIADGAGGVECGYLAAETVIRETKNNYSGITSAKGWKNALQKIDHNISDGESTAVVIDLHSDSIIGASVGDSQALIVNNGEVFDLTKRQNRKPLLGSHKALPIEFEYGPLNGTLLAATDGFFNYAKSDSIISIISFSDFFEIPRKCVELVRLPSGDLWDDIAIVACRIRKLQRSQKRYSI